VGVEAHDEELADAEIPEPCAEAGRRERAGYVLDEQPLGAGVGDGA
jgi:hypothetical protein